MSAGSRLPSSNERVPHHDPVRAAFVEYVGTPKSERRPIEEHLPDLRLETVAAVMNPARRERIIDADHGSEDEERSEQSEEQWVQDIDPKDEAPKQRQTMTNKQF